MCKKLEHDQERLLATATSHHYCRYTSIKGMSAQRVVLFKSASPVSLTPLLGCHSIALIGLLAISTTLHEKNESYLGADTEKGEQRTSRDVRG